MSFYQQTQTPLLPNQYQQQMNQMNISTQCQQEQKEIEQPQVKQTKRKPRKKQSTKEMQLQQETIKPSECKMITFNIAFLKMFIQLFINFNYHLFHCFQLIKYFTLITCIMILNILQQQ